MSKYLNIEDLLEILEHTKNPHASKVRARLERLTQDAAELVSDQVGADYGLATWEGKTMGGCCIPFWAMHTKQQLPTAFIETEADIDGDWETQDGQPVESPPNKKPVGVGVFVLGGAHGSEKTLMSLRLKARTYVDFWQNPGGTIEEGETPIDAAKRELAEETGLLFRLDRFNFVGTTEDKYPDGTAYEMHWYVVRAPIAFNMMPPNPEPEKHTDWEWAEHAEMVDLQQRGKLINSTFDMYVKSLTK